MSTAAAELPSPSELATLGKEVDLPQIDPDLRAMWMDEVNGTKASLTNLAIYGENPTFLLRNADLLREVTQETACRALLICNQQDQGDEAPAEAASARAWITAHCQLRGGKKSACSEQIAFLLSDASAAMVRNLVFSHLDSDLPLVLWWQGALSERFEDRLYSVVDRLIVDSARWKDPASDFPRLIAAAEEPGSRFSINDMSWTRTHKMRIALASCFEDPVNLEKLPHLRTATITHGTSGTVPALLLVAWIADRLGGGSIERTDDHTFQIGDRLTITLEASGEGEGIPSLQLAGEDCDFTFIHEPGARSLKTRLCSGGYCTERLLPADPESRATLLLRQLERAGNNTLYLQIAPKLLPLL